MGRLPPVIGWLDDPGVGSLCFHRRSGGVSRWERHPHPELSAHARAAASVLADEGARPDGAVIVILDTGLPFVGALFGAMGLGAIPTAVQPPSFLARRSGYESQLARILAQVRPQVVVAEESLADVTSAASQQAGCRPSMVSPAALAAGDQATALPFGGSYALRQLTSGSTGTPKGVLLTAEQLSDHVVALGRWLQLGTGDIGVSWLPLHHDMGLVHHLLRPLVLDLDEYLMSPAAFIRDPCIWLTTLSEQGGTMTSAPTFGYRYLLDRIGDSPLDGLDLSRCRAAVMGAERIDADVVTRFRAKLAPHGLRASAVLPAYGLAEATLAVTVTPRDEPLSYVSVPNRPAALGDELTITGRGHLGDEPVESAPARAVQVSSGRPLPGISVAVVADDGTALPEGTLGEVAVESPFVGTIETAPAPPPPPPSRGAGWQLLTGDAGFILDGSLYVLGRLGDSVSVRGQRVFAETLEAEMASATGGDVVVVIGEELGGPVVVSFVDHQLTADHVQPLHAVAWRCLDRTTRSLVVRTTRGSLPRTSSGKPQRRRIWSMYTSGRFEQQVLSIAGREETLVGDPTT